MKIVIIDDHRMFAEGVRFLVERIDSNVEVAHAQDASSALKLIPEHPDTDIILMDIGLPGVNGLSLLGAMRARNIWTPVLMVSGSQSPEVAHSAINAGALGFVGKNCSGDELLHAMNTVLNGEVYLPPQWTVNKDSYLDNTNSDSSKGLTPRQLEIVDLLAQGLPNKVIADRMSIKENTIKVHLQNIFRVLNVQNRTACIHEAQKRGLISPDNN